MCLGVPGQIVAITSVEKKLGMVNVGGVKRETNLACVAPEDAPLESLLGAWVLVHVGFAMSLVDAEEAQRTLDLLRELGEVREAHEAMTASDAALRRPDTERAR